MSVHKGRNKKSHSLGEWLSIYEKDNYYWSNFLLEAYKTLRASAFLNSVCTSEIGPIFTSLSTFIEMVMEVRSASGSLSRS